MKRIRGAIVGGVGAAVLVVGWVCASSAWAQVRCGEGTVLRGEECVAASVAAEAPAEPLRLTRAQRTAIAGNERLARKLASSAFDYFRFQHRAFTGEACRAFQAERHQMPVVNLHGDAHLEQYAATQLGFGLNDFDEAGFGPATVDLLRFGASLHLVCAEASFECDAAAAMRVFLDVYLQATLKPGPPNSAPMWVRRVRAESSSTREGHLAFAEKNMREVPASTEAGLRRAWAQMSAMLLATGFAGTAEYFELTRLGRINLGIGSALVEKYLLRVRGPSDEPGDDRIIEIKLYTATERTACVFHPPTGGVLYAQVMLRRLGRLTPEVLAYLPTEELHQGDSGDTKMFWVQSWDPDYMELKREDLRSQMELEQVAADVGLQLGRGHCSHLTAPLEDQHRFAHDGSIRRYRPRIETAAADLARAVEKAWQSERHDLQPK